MSARAWRTPGAWALVAALLIAAGVTPALAQSDGGGDDAAGEGDQRAEAERLFRTGERAYHAGKYEMAVRAFEASYELLPAPQIAFSAAQAYRLQYFVDKQSPGLRRAVELYRIYLERLPEGGRREVAVTHLAELEPILMRLVAADAGSLTPEPVQQKPRLALLAITSPIEGAQASVGDHSGPMPFEVELEPGRYEVTVTAEGYLPATKSVAAVAGAVIPVEVELTPVPARVSVTTEDGAQVLVNGRSAAATPLARPIELAPGSYFVSVSKRGRHGWSRELELSRGQELSLDAELSTTGQRVASYVVFGVAGLSLLGAGYAGFEAIRVTSDADELRDKFDAEGLTRAELEEYQDLRDRRGLARNATFGLVTVGALAGITGFVLYWFDTPANDVDAGDGVAAGAAFEPVITPAVTSDSVGVSVQGRF
ncbi:PEGA domain-containing protein [Haliangium sp.]|uniref:PEGA domain-containing protein n=1 Tax=Haliangium sp. TaxID=2663208 RepID=UPI003D1200B4